MTRVPSLGRRGEGWVVLQSLALVTIGAAGVVGRRWPRRASGPMRVVGVGLAVAGGALGTAGIRRLGPALTALPRPIDGAPLHGTGAYARVRHPIYGGILLVSLGWAALSSPVALLPWSALALVFEGKRIREEAWLEERHPAYRVYRARVRRRFVPFVW